MSDTTGYEFTTTTFDLLVNENSLNPHKLYTLCMLGIDFSKMRKPMDDLVDIVLFSKETNYIYVKFKITDYPEEIFTSTYRFTVSIEDTQYHVYQMPDIESMHLEQIKLGNAHLLPKRIKENICSMSYLPFNFKAAGNIKVTHTYLQLLYDDTPIREAFEELLNAKVTGPVLRSFKECSTLGIPIFIEDVV